MQEPHSSFTRHTLYYAVQSGDILKGLPEYFIESNKYFFHLKQNKLATKNNVLLYN